MLDFYYLVNYMSLLLLKYNKDFQADYKIYNSFLNGYLYLVYNFKFKLKLYYLYGLIKLYSFKV
jgi:hypothetical protein